MNRLQKKCAIASAGVHLLLFSVLLVGPAFVSSKSKSDDMPILDFIPLKTTDDMVSGGGNPNGRLPEALPPPAPPKPPASAPPAQQEKVVPETKQVEKEVAKESTESSLVPSTDRKAKKIEVSTKLVTRKRSAVQSDDTSAQEEREAKEYADRRRRMANLLSSAAGHIEGGVSSATSIELKGLGGGGVPYANFYQAVKSVYARAWVLPDGIDDDEATTAASVTIARDGKVIAARIIRSSANVAVDQSVRVVLDRVKYAAPLPDTEKADERTVTINFNVKAKKALG
jgi:TonB family protein